MSLGVSAQGLKLNDKCVFESRGVDVHIYDNPGGLRIYQKDRIVASSGGLYLGQEPFVVENNNVDIASDKIEVKLVGGAQSVFLKAKPSGLGLALSVFLPEPIPVEMSGSVVLEVNLLPGLYLGKMCLLDGKPSVVSANSQVANHIVIAPESDDLRISFRSENLIWMNADISGVKIRSAVPAGAVGEVLQWYVEPSYDSRWARDAELGYSHIGYVNAQKKLAVIMIDAKSNPDAGLLIYKINEDGYRQQVLQPSVKIWGRNDERSSYAVCDFSMLKESGIYCIEYDGVMSEAFVVSEDVFDGKYESVLRRMPAALENGRYNADAVISSLASLWEDFRPESDFTANGVPDVIDMIRMCTNRVVNGDVFSTELTADEKFGRISALTAAGRVLRGFDDDLSEKACNYAELLWNMNSSLESARKNEAAEQMWFTTGSDTYKKVFYTSVTKALVSIDGFADALPIYGILDAKSRKKMDDLRNSFAGRLKSDASATPYGVPAMAGDEMISWALQYYRMWRTFPDSVDPSVLLACLSSVYGKHSYADEAMLDALAPESMPGFIALSMACEKVAAALAR